jgi:NTP pyrophosphatase (non-canonical NTP hydrolase)
MMEIDETVFNEVRAMQFHHRKHWRDKPEEYWMARLMQEVGELASALVGDHADSPDLELCEIASICLNWLDMRASKEQIGVSKKERKGEHQR